PAQKDQSLSREETSGSSVRSFASGHRPRGWGRCWGGLRAAHPCTPGRVAAVDPGGDDRAVLAGRLFPGEMPGVEHVEPAVGQPGVEELGVGDRHDEVLAPGDDLYKSEERR